MEVLTNFPGGERSVCSWFTEVDALDSGDLSLNNFSRNALTSSGVEFFVSAGE